MTAKKTDKERAAQTRARMEAKGYVLTPDGWITPARKAETRKRQLSREERAALASNPQLVEEERQARELLGLPALEEAGKRRRGRPPRQAKSAVDTLAEIEKKPANRLSARQRKVMVLRGDGRARAQAEVARIVAAVLKAKKQKFPLSAAPARGGRSAFDVAAETLGMNAGAVFEVWRRDQRRSKAAKVYKI